MAVRIPQLRPASGRKSKRAAAKPRPGATGGRRRTLPGLPALRAWMTSKVKRRAVSGAAQKTRAGGTSRRRPARRPRVASQPPLLQRRTLGPVFARVAVLVVAFVAMVGFAVALAKVTLVPSPGSDALVHTNLRPGATIRAYLDQPQVRDSAKQIGGNVVLGVPFGVLLPALFPRIRGALRTVLVTAVVMTLVETAQGALVEGRAFDIDDVLLNTFGALLGYVLIGRRLGHALHPPRARWWHRRGPGPARPGRGGKTAGGAGRTSRPFRKRP